MVGARAPGTEQIFVTKEEKWHFLKDALWGGGGTHRSWPGGRGGRPRLDSRGRVSGKGWLGGERLGGPTGGRGVREAGQGLGRGCKGFGSGGVSGRGMGHKDGANFARLRGWGQGGGARARGGARASVPGGKW